jgi:hypothetical protein
MHKKLPLLLIFLAWAGNGYTQGSTVPDSVRAMIERSQATSQFEQTARMQMSVQFGDFLDALTGGPQRKSQVEAALVEVLRERAELSDRVVNGQASAAELGVVGDFAYLRAHLAPLLNATELSVLDRQSSGPSDAQLKKEYAEDLSRTAGGLTAANRELVLDTLIKYLRSDKGDTAGLGRLSVDDLVNQQSRSLMRASEELQSQLSGDQLQQVNAFLNQLQSNLTMNRSMLDAPQ